MIDAVKVDRMIENGLSAVCAWCENFWRVFDQHRGEEAHCGMDCGGPASHMAFPKYRGPMEGRMLSFCFICGKDADAGVDIKGRGAIGVCEKHVPQLKRMLNSRVGSKPPVVREHEVLKLRL